MRSKFLIGFMCLFCTVFIVSAGFGALMGFMMGAGMSVVVMIEAERDNS